MYRQQHVSKFQQWLQYSPLIYNHLVMTPATNLSKISSVKWLRGATISRLSFKYMESFACLAGASVKAGRSVGFDGGFSIYRTAIAQDQDDDRLQNIVKLRSHWNFREQLDIIQQYGNSLQNKDRNNMFAMTYKNHPILLLMPTTKLLEQGVHIPYAQDMCYKIDGHKLPITCVKWANFQTSGHKLFTASQDSMIMQYDIEKITRERQMKYHRSSVRGITPMYDYSPTWGEGPIVSSVSSVLASASQDGYIFIWDNRAPTPVKKINPKQKQLHSIECISQKCLLSGGEQGTIKMFDIRNQKQYLFETRNSKISGHTTAIKKLKANRFGNSQLKKKSETGRIKFTSCEKNGRIIEWSDKLQFVHEGHQSQSTFDLSDNNPLCLSGQLLGQIFMIWQSGVSMCQQQL